MSSGSFWKHGSISQAGKFGEFRTTISGSIMLFGLVGNPQYDMMVFRSKESKQILDRILSWKDIGFLRGFLFFRLRGFGSE